MAAFAGTVEEEWKPNPPSGEGRRDTQKSVLEFSTQLCQGRLPQQVDNKKKLRAR